MYETTADLMEQWCDSRIEADMEMAEMQRAAREREADRKAGKCWHDGGYLYRETAFYPEQLTLSPGQMWCYDCKQVVRTDYLDCHKCGLGEEDCMGRRGYADDHDHFIMPVRITVCNVME